MHCACTRDHLVRHTVFRSDHHCGATSSHRIYPFPSPLLFHPHLFYSSSYLPRPQYTISSKLLTPIIQASTWVSLLASEEVSRTLRRSDLDKLLEILEVIPVGIVASQQQGLGQDRVGTVMRAFYASLFSTMTPHFERLQDLELRETTRRATAEAVAAAHEKVSAQLKSHQMTLDQT